MTGLRSPEPWLRALGSRRIQYVLVAAAILGAIIGLDTLVLHLTVDPLADVRAYYDAGARLNSGLPLYEQLATTDDPAFYRYPPLLAVLFRPLAVLPFETAALIWEAVLVVAFIATVLLIGVRRRWTWLLLGWLAAPICWALAIGQAHVLVTLFLTIGTPLGVALAANLKLLPILVAVFWAARRDGRALLRLAGWMVALALIQFALEPAGTIAFLTFTDLGQVGDVINLSPFVVSPFLWVAVVVVLAVVAWRTASTRFGWGAVVVLAVFATPRLLMYQLSSLLAVARPDAVYTAPDASATVDDARPAGLSGGDVDRAGSR